MLDQTVSNKRDMLINGDPPEQSISPSGDNTALNG